MNKFTATVFDKQEGRRIVVSKVSSDFGYLKKQINNTLRKNPSRYINPKYNLQLNLEKSFNYLNLAEK
jgi:hypothetical protein